MYPTQTILCFLTKHNPKNAYVIRALVLFISCTGYENYYVLRPTRSTILTKKKEEAKVHLLVDRDTKGDPKVGIGLTPLPACVAITRDCDVIVVTAPATQTEGVEFGHRVNEGLSELGLGFRGTG